MRSTAPVESVTVSAGQRVNMRTLEVVTPSDVPGTLRVLVEERGGALDVAHVQSPGPVGIQAGDTIVSIDGRDVSEWTLRISKRLLVDGAVSSGQRMTFGLAGNVEVQVVQASQCPCGRVNDAGDSPYCVFHES